MFWKLSGSRLRAATQNFIFCERDWYCDILAFWWLESIVSLIVWLLFLWSSGDIVGLHQTGPTADASISSGIVTRITSTSISVAFDQSEELNNVGDECQYYVVKLANDVTYRRLRRWVRLGFISSLTWTYHALGSGNNWSILKQRETIGFVWCYRPNLWCDTLDVINW